MRRIFDDNSTWYGFLPSRELGARARSRVDLDDVSAHALIARLAAEPLGLGTLRALLHDDGADGAARELSADELLSVVGCSLCDGRFALHEEHLPKYAGGGALGPAPAVPEPPLDPFPATEGPRSASPSATATPPCVWALELTFDGANPLGHGFELDALHLRARVVSGACTTPRGRFQLLRADGSSVAAHEVATDSGADVAWELPAPELGPDEDHRTLRARFVVGDQTYDSDNSVVAWPRSLSLRALHKDTRRPVEGFTFRVKQADAGAVATTDTAGEVTHPLAKPEPYTVEAEAPSEVTAWTDAVGRRREALGAKYFVSAFVAPKPAGDGAAVRQYVNLTTASHGRDRKGSVVSIAVGVEGDEGLPPGGRAGREGDVIHVKVIFGRKSKRNAPHPSVSGLDGVTAAAGAYVGSVRLGASGEPARFTVELGEAGGDTCLVQIGSTRAVADGALRFENWRKLYYQVTHPSVVSAPDMSLMTAALKKVYVQYEKYKTLAFEEAETPAPPAGSWFDGPMIGLAGRCVNIGDHNRSFFHTKFDDTKNPLGVHVLVCNTQYDGGSPAHSTAIALPVLLATPKITFPADGASVWGVVAPITAGSVFPTALQDGGRGVRDARWVAIGGGSGAIPDDHVFVNWNTHRNKVYFKLPALALIELAGGRVVWVMAKALWCLGPYNGEADANRQLIRSRAAKGMNGTMTHELGHTMQQVLYAVPPGLDAASHGWKYDQRGHSGNHCAFGITKTVYDGTGDLTGRTDCKCVMYGEGATERPNTFCEKCAPFVRAQSLKDVTT